MAPADDGLTKRHPMTPTPPPDFQHEANRVDRYLDRALNYAWTQIKTGGTVPKGVTCLVQCGATRTQQADARCLAFAAFVRGHVRWYGVTAGYQDPTELYGVTGYVQIADTLEFFGESAATAGRTQ